MKATPLERIIALILLPGIILIWSLVSLWDWVRNG